MSEEEQQQPKARQTSPLPGVSRASTSMAAAESIAPVAGSGGRATPEMKRSAVRSLIQRYFHQLQSGCGNENCTNANCASSGKVAPMTPNEVAARALQLFSQDAQLCESTPDTLASSSRSHLGLTADCASGSHNSPQLDVDMLSPNDSSSSSSSSSTSTITSASTTTTTSTHSNTAPQDATVSTSSPLPFLELIAVGSLLQTKLSTPATETTASNADSSGSGACTPTRPAVEFLDAVTVERMYEECRSSGSYDLLHHAITDVFSRVDRLGKSFCRAPETEQSSPSSKVQALLAKSPCALNKEELRTLEGEHDKDEDSTQALDQASSSSSRTEVNTSSRLSGEVDEDDPMEQSEAKESSDEDALTSDTLVDFSGLRRVNRLLMRSPNRSISEKLMTSVIQLAESIRYMGAADWEQENVLHCLVICFDIATNTSNSVMDMEYLDEVLPKLCKATSVLPVRTQARLACIWAKHCADQLQTLVASCQQQITLQVLLDEDSVRENESIISLTKVLKIVFYANILASELECPSCLVSLPQSAESATDEDADAGAAALEDDLFIYSSVTHPHMPKFAEDKLEKLLKVHAGDCRQPLVPLEDFYNEALSDHIHMNQDYLSYKTLAMESEIGSSHTNYFSFMLYAFILMPATKVDALYYDSRMRMYSERYTSLYSIINNFGDGQDGAPRPDLKLTVRREQLINDALIGLELVAMSNPKDLKKQLVVEFVGEQGIDEGGVSKEFFQLIVEEIFNPAFGMFVQQEETNNMWFNAMPFENGAQFTLIGIIIGLAIYNNVILAVNFPMVVYRKLMGYRGTFNDLNDWSPTLYKSLMDLLKYEGQDMEEVFQQTFKISYSNVFGEMVEHELVPHGGEVAVGQHNKHLFVSLYSDYLLNVNIEQQFKAFRKGFEMVTDESPLKLLFRPEEIEMLVCGSREFNFVELEQSTEYEGGYTEETQIIKDFWSIVHGMPPESKRKLLEFTTGSDRVPVGGLRCLRLLITRHGPDSERLPTSHTCFNVLLLPEYSSKEKLEERLLKAINYSKGFGML
ncbi:ubiquitin-protein ligase E3A [Scaptodrosophila lebanonensis]|uniref:HECT-type E3 ubiquitin transferase n=1 Tax=Drosophila lebanonensis TaxID=7225 RepID=A0A6J2T4M5_DROLE|nr:ubiquitin-protein ligase E3A [Scaptodrosophila lebanonensis]